MVKDSEPAFINGTIATGAAERSQVHQLVVMILGSSFLAFLHEEPDGNCQCGKYIQVD
jgi:hypothetical protein